MENMSASIPGHLSTKFIQRALETGLRTNGILVRYVNFQNITMGGENYCSNIYRAQVQFQRTDDGDKMEEEKSLIIKHLPMEKQYALKRLSIYTKETLFYLDIKPKMEALMWYKKVPWTLGARHFYSTTYPEETIVFEDLCKQRFQQCSRQCGFDAIHAKLVLQKLAEYHALSMLMIEKDPELIIERYPYGLLNIDSIKSPHFKALFGAQLLKLASLIDNCAELSHISKQLLKYYDNFTERVLKAVYPLMGQINVLNHGDLWNNNIFFRYGSTENPIEVRFIDFQLCFCGSPGFDINYFLNTSVQLDVLKNQRQSLIVSYYNTLVETLKNLPYDKALPTYDQILEEIEQREAYGFFIAFAFFPLMSMVSIDSHDNSLEQLHDAEFARKKIELMFHSNSRTMETLKYILKRADDLGIFI